MKQFQLDRINKIAPYEVKAEGKQYVFDTAHKQKSPYFLLNKHY